MHGIKNLPSPCPWNHRARLRHRNIAQHRCALVREGDVRHPETSNRRPVRLDVSVQGLICSHTGVIYAEVDSSDGGTREAVSHGIVFPRHMLDVGGELRDESQMTLLPGRPRFRHLSHGKNQRLVVHKNSERASFQQETEVSDR